MPESIIKLPGKVDIIDIRCPKCNSSQIVVYQDTSGYYKVRECHKCQYKNEE